VSLARPVALAAVALIASACSLTNHTAGTDLAKVLGQVHGATLVVGQPAPGKPGQLGAVSCADARRCWAVGVPGPNDTLPAGAATVIVATTNGGLTWSAEHVVGGYTPELSGVSCPTKTDCMAVGSNGASGGVVVTTHDGGATWASGTTPTNAVAVSSVVCAGVDDCTALVSNGTVTWSSHSTDFGQTWTQEGNLPPSFVAAGALSCASGGTCLVPGYVPTTAGHGAGAVAISHDGGQTWAAATVPTTSGVLQATACVSASVCLAAGSTSTTVSDVVPGTGEVLDSADGGTTWTAGPVTSSIPVADIFGLDCPTVEVCVMVGTRWQGSPAVGTGAVAQSTDGGSTFTTSPAAYVPLSLTALSCPGSSACVAVGGDSVARVTLTAPRASHQHTPASGAPPG
jgi:hypothetical protein